MLFENDIKMIGKVALAVNLYFPGALKQVQHHYGVRTAATLSEGVGHRLEQIIADTQAFANRIEVLLQQRKAGRMLHSTKQELGQAVESAAIDAAELGALLHELAPQAYVPTMFELDITDVLGQLEFASADEIEFALHAVHESIELLQSAYHTVLPQEE